LELFHCRPQHSSLRNRLFNAFACLGYLINTNQIENKNADSFLSLDEKGFRQKSFDPSPGKRLVPYVRQFSRIRTSGNFQPPG
jgi:hypothetical protein